MEFFPGHCDSTSINVSTEDLDNNSPHSLFIFGNFSKKSREDRFIQDIH
jgi:hypothetical protein